MRTFFEFTQGTNGAENPTIPAGQGAPPVPGQYPPPVYPQPKPIEHQPVANKPTPANEDEILEKLTNDVQRVIDRLFKTLDKHRMNKQKAMGLLSSIISNVANQYGLTATNVRQAGQAGLKTNNEPVSPPMQPMANG